MKNNVQKGSYGEKIAATYLCEHGYLILETNYRCTLGEIDIICKKGEYIVFVEVKFRKNLSFGYPKEAVTYQKQQKIKKVSLHYITTRNIKKYSFRYDIIEVLGAKEVKVTHIENAFY